MRYAFRINVSGNATAPLSMPTNPARATSAKNRRRHSTTVPRKLIQCDNSPRLKWHPLRCRKRDYCLRHDRPRTFLDQQRRASACATHQVLNNHGTRTMARRSAEAMQTAPRAVPAAFGNTIASLPQVSPLRSLCVEETDTLQPQLASSQRLFKIRMVDSQGHRHAAGLLVRRRYAWRGYRVNDAERVQPNRLTFSACDIDNVVATISVGLDSIAGLFVDQLYGPEIDLMRAPGRKLCEFTKLAVEASVRSRPVLAALFHIAYIHARCINRCTDLFVEVNPRHVAFYKQMLDFTVCGPERVDARVGAAAVLLRLDLAVAEQRIEELGGRPDLASTHRSLYPHFFSASEESQIERRLRLVG